MNVRLKSVDRVHGLLFGDMSRNGVSYPSRLQEVCAGSPVTTGLAVAMSGGGEVKEKSAPSTEPVLRCCVLSIHDTSHCKDDAVLNLALFPTGEVKEGDLLLINNTNSTTGHQQSTNATHSSQAPTEPPPNGHRMPQKSNGMGIDSSMGYIFRVTPIGPDMLLKQPQTQISISQNIATAFNLTKGSEVLLSKIESQTCGASHVELVFRDQYLARADMWRLINAELAHRCIYKGQRIEFLNSLKANVKSIFIGGRRVQSALFNSSTKPIFRSESARYVLFIQMSKEMWDFDAEGTGEIMFDKLINGFLPELFKRWQQLQVRHLVSIVLFTRMLYDDRQAEPSVEEHTNIDVPNEAEESPSKDYYRVVVSDMASGEWPNIMERLKREFKVFLRDTSIRTPAFGDYVPLGEGLSAASAALPSDIISGRPSAATQGNILEAINLASSQFSSDYIDRDLVRTGVSIVVISPGAGLFEVDFNLLVATTDNLTDNGVGIDLVCLSRMPLHSVPLFRYKQPLTELVPPANQEGHEVGSSIKCSFSNTMSYETPSVSPSDPPPGAARVCLWSHGIPHWIDVSFWTCAAGGDHHKAQPSKVVAVRTKNNLDIPKHKPFVPRVRMYALQMMGVMEDAISDISIPQLPITVLQSPESRGPLRVPWLKGTVKNISPAGSLSSRDERSGVQTPRLSTSPIHAYGKLQQQVEPSLRWMDEYDDHLFRDPAMEKKRARRATTRRRTLPKLNRPRGERAPVRDTNSNSDGGFAFAASPADTGRFEVSQKSRGNRDSDSRVAFSNNQTNRKPGLMPRQISFGLRGLGIGAPRPVAAITSTELSTGHATPASPSQSGLLSQLSATTEDRKTQTVSVAAKNQDNPSSISVHLSESSQDETQSTDSEPQYSSRPIPIRKTTPIRISDEVGSRYKSTSRPSRNTSKVTEPHDRVAAIMNLSAEEEMDLDQEIRPKYGPQLPTLSPSTSLAPWLTVLNPSNPSKTGVIQNSRLGRWHHLFPRPLRASQIKWKSLCSPAAVPLTTEDFPSADQLAEEFRERCYLVTLPEEMDLSEHPRSLASEMLAFRLSRGFQIVVGQRVADATDTPLFEDLDVFDEKILSQPGASMYLSRGSTIHRLTRLGADRIEMKALIRHTTAKVSSELDDGRVLYTPLIRSMLAKTYESQAVSIASQKSLFNWDMIDSFIAGHERPQAAQYVANLRPWRARFVLIPNDAPSNAWRAIRSSEDNEEEIRLEGIRELTRIWQQHRYIPPEERRFQAAVRSRKDTNPLDVSYHTKNPSAVIISELENAAEREATGMPVQILPEPDLLQRSNLNMRTLAEMFQSGRGVRLTDRRWHWRFHHDSFIGLELTTWLLENFRDVDTRDEAVDLGKELMENGLFEHVEGRHGFRDGNYFYQLSEEYRVPKPESRGWFGRVKASVPSTPLTEAPPLEQTAFRRSRANSDTVAVSKLDVSTPSNISPRLSVALSKSLLYDVDHRKRSYRPEFINLHYDRLHNPDNCYHIRIEWMNTTSRLIQAAVVSWATTVDKYGLRLVEVPIGEASSITSMHPFRAPYSIKLAQAPPAKQPMSYIESHSFSLQTKATGKHFYQKAILKQFNFVLDFEAASDFPSGVDVTYSWGSPDYRYAQYIHRTGVLIAQITEDGHFLLLANRLYNNRSAANATSQQDKATSNLPDRGPMFYRSSPHRGGRGPPTRSSPRTSPFPSPADRTALDVPAKFSRASASPISSSKSRGSTRPDAAVVPSTPEELTQNFQSFCSDAAGLEKFYTEQLSRTSSPGPNTPFMSSKTPNRGPETPVADSGIPNLALPTSLVEARRQSEEVDTKPWQKTRAIGNGSPRVKATETDGKGGLGSEITN